MRRGRPVRATIPPPTCGIFARRRNYNDALALHRKEIAMNEEAFNLSIRKFLKMVGISSQREIERSVLQAVDDGAIRGTETFPAHVTLEVPGLKINVKFDGEIK